MNWVPNNFVQASPVFVFVLFLSKVPGAADDNRYARKRLT
jgi:hypothetical protein